MHLRTTPQHILAITVAAAALFATPAMARAADSDLRASAKTSSLAGTPAPGQDLRGERARDAARTLTEAAPAVAKQDLRGEHARDAARTGTVAAPAAAKQDLRGERARNAARPGATPVIADPPALARNRKALPPLDSGPATWFIVLAALAGATAGVVRIRNVT